MTRARGGHAEEPGSEATSFEPGSDEDFDRLYRLTYPGLVRALTLIIGSSDAAEDCVQEAFVRAYSAWPRWQPTAPAGAWMYRIAVNTAYSYLRRRRLQSIAQTLLMRSQKTAEDPADWITRSGLVAALKELPLRQRSAIVLRYHSGYAVGDLARMLGVTERTVARDLNAALTRLRKTLGEQWGIPSPISPTPRVVEVTEP